MNSMERDLERLKQGLGIENHKDGLISYSEGYPSSKRLSTRYNLLLNGKFYGTGDLPYMYELIADYIRRMESFGVKEVEFKIEERKNSFERNEPLTLTEEQVEQIINAPITTVKCDFEYLDTSLLGEEERKKHIEQLFEKFSKANKTEI